jgi:hypothetical protein
MSSPLRTLDTLWEKAIVGLDEAAGRLERGEQGVEKTFRLARHNLLAAQRLATALGEERYPIEDELTRLDRLAATISSDRLEPNAPRRQLAEFDDAVNRGDGALKRGESKRAAVEYLRAFEILDAILSISTAPTAGDEESCQACLDAPATTMIQLCGRSLHACASCESALSGRFPTEDRVRIRREAIREDIEAALGWIPGPDWLSATPPEGGDNPPSGIITSTDQDPQNQEMTPGDVFLIRDFTALSQHVGHPATPSEIDQYSEYSSTDFLEVFGSWDSVLQQAGFANEE